MTRRYFWLAPALALLCVACSSPKDANSVLRDAQEAMGTVNSIKYGGTGVSGNFGQALTAGEDWPRRELTAYSRSVNYAERSALEEITFAQPVFGGQQQNAAVNGDKAWNIGPDGPTPQPAAAQERQLHIWLTPHGFLKAAADSGNATLTEAEGANVIAFTALDKYKIEGTIDAQNRVSRVATAVPNSVLGDTELVASYSDYRDFSGVQFPGKIVIDQGGSPIWDLTITSVTPNAAVDLPVPPAAASATVPPVQTASVKLADGVWHITGGSHHSVLVEFNDHVAVVEAPLTEARSLAVIAEVKKLVPNKPIRYLLTTHHHFDHIGGIRTYAAEGATIVTHESNVQYLEKALAAPATLEPDMQAKSPRMPVLQGVSDKHVLTDGKQTIEVHATAGDTHTNEYTLVYLPGPRMLIEADAYSPAATPDAPPPPMPPPNAVALYDSLQRLKLNVATIVPIHGRGAVPIAELRRFIGRS